MATSNPSDVALQLAGELCNDLMDFALDWPDELWDKIVNLRDAVQRVGTGYRYKVVSGD